ncbi:peptidoglycan DD-metalloendopeptidase family protein [Thiosulfativibrio zosterae]|uniref:Peptidase M23 n=1 Tax=Thiosulfativibrio zosterae TaxID=2675053 RepID=A0A6F8PQD0_9GAMM|nr:peptidoglycan DD-metalloendopeptidase family protein [Thiosulfativibrio zosterae]BBP44238.1 peptidase M23 [Thiosulfativibrio zosterae]
MIKKTLNLLITYLKIGLIALIPVTIGIISILAIGETNASIMIKKNQLPLPDIQSVDLTQLEAKKAAAPESLWEKHSVKIKPNGSLSEALDQIGLNKQITFDILQLKNSHYLTQLRAGDELQIWTDQGQLKKILYPQSEEQDFVLSEVPEGFQIEAVNHKVQIKVVSVAGTIDDSFYLSGKSAGLSAKTIMNLADIFTWEIDFIRQLRHGDPFKVIYEQRYIKNQYIGDGDILAASIDTGGETHTAFLLKDESGKSLGYFDAEQNNLKKTFLKNPVDYVRITSTFKPKRFHPVLKKWRAHRGVDYAGPIGTPIHATGDGQIITRTWSNSYGRLIMIQHANKYVTVYGHMSKYGKYPKNAWVKQGDVIGYIGQSGLASGPHLHYEFRVNGVHQDPLKVKFPNAGPVPKKYRAEFANYASLMLAQMERLSPDTQLVGHFE